MLCPRIGLDKGLARWDAGLDALPVGLPAQYPGPHNPRYSGPQSAPRVQTSADYRKAMIRGPLGLVLGTFISDGTTHPMLRKLVRSKWFEPFVLDVVRHLEPANKSSYLAQDVASGLVEVCSLEPTAADRVAHALRSGGADGARRACANAALVWVGDLPDDPIQNLSYEHCLVSLHRVAHPEIYGHRPVPLQRRCLACGRSDDAGNRKRCMGCMAVVFCDRKCQRAVWNDHKKRCLPPPQDAMDTLDVEGLRVGD